MLTLLIAVITIAIVCGLLAEKNDRVEGIVLGGVVGLAVGIFILAGVSSVAPEKYVANERINVGKAEYIRYISTFKNPVMNYFGITTNSSKWSLSVDRQTYEVFDD